MNKLQRILVIFLLILSLGVVISTFKAVKVFLEKKEDIRALYLKNTDLTKKGQDLKEKLEGREKDLTQTKLDLEDVRSKLEEEKERSVSFQTKYESEKERADGLDTDLNRVQLILKQEQEAKAELSSEIEKIKEEKDVLSRDLKEVRQAKETFEAIVAEIAKEVREETATGRIIKTHPRGFLAIEVEKDSYDRREADSLIAGKREIKLSGIEYYVIILDVDRGEDISELKDGDMIKYKYRIREVAPIIK